MPEMNTLILSHAMVLRLGQCLGIAQAAVEDLGSIEGLRPEHVTELYEDIESQLVDSVEGDLA